MSVIESAVIVYAEDEDDVRKQIATYLRRRVKVLHEAINGQEGLRLIQEHNPDIIITDLEMPVMNGLEMIKKIREIYDGTKPIIVITGFMDSDHFSELADVYVYKPTNLKNLVEAMEELLVKYN